MKNIGFIGAYDKTDLLLNIAKILTTMNFKVLVVDATNILLEFATFCKLFKPFVIDEVSFLTRPK